VIWLAAGIMCLNYGLGGVVVVIVFDLERNWEFHIMINNRRQ
jgi:hypothetical protein